VTELERERRMANLQVYSVLNRREPLLYHAERCLQICEGNNIGDWDIAFAHEAMARAYAISGNRTECEKYLRLTREAGDKIKEKGDRDYFSKLETLSR